MTEPLEPLPEPANLRVLRILVTVLTVVMIGGLLTIVALFVIRFSSSPPMVPDSVTLPDGLKAEAFTLGPDWYAVVTEGGKKILIFDRETGVLRQTVEVK
ncbi:DUF6476 family protein [Seohaeicola zhoushanensis]|nr:DUF6476 family protein [Seohaeicola zhoushanensis]